MRPYKVTTTLALLLFSSCSAPFTAQQEGEDFLILAQSVSYNSKEDVVHAFVLRWTPDAIHAISGYRGRQQHWTEKERQEYEQALVEEHYGEHGDSTTFLISLANSQYPCIPPIIITPLGAKQLIPPSMMPCIDIPIQDIHHKIWLENDKGVKLYAIFVSGRKNINLTTEELLWAKFQVGEGSFNWISSSQEIYLMIDIKPQLIKLKIK